MLVLITGNQVPGMGAGSSLSYFRTVASRICISEHYAYGLGVCETKALLLAPSYLHSKPIYSGTSGDLASRKRVTKVLFRELSS